MVDLENVKVSDSAADPKPHGDLLSGIRTGVRKGGGLRVVFDLTRESRPKSFLLEPTEPYGHRLVIDLPDSQQVVSEPVRQMPNDKRNIIVAIDAGHGGEDPGAIGLAGTHEKEVVLSISRKIKAQLDAVDGFEGRLIRSGDYFIELNDRPAKARENRADLFVTIHADAFYNRKVKGASVFVLSPRRATSETARWLADRQNRSDLVGGVKLNDKDETLAAVLLDLSQSASRDASRRAATSVFSSLKASSVETHRSQVEGISMAVLTSPDIPSMLVETGFISNPTEEKRLRSADYQQKMAHAVAGGILDFFAANPPPGTLVADQGLKRDRHIVTRGETLSQIAKRHQVTVSQIMAVNSLNSDRVRIGDTLTIPAI